LFCVGVGAAQQTSERTKWRRLSEVPVLTPQGSGWEERGARLIRVVMRDGKLVMLYRAQDSNGTSRLGYAESLDGLHFTRREKPVLSPEAPYEKDGGVEDPRIVKIGATFYLTYTAYNKKDAQLCLRCRAICCIGSAWACRACL